MTFAEKVHLLWNFLEGVWLLRDQVIPTHPTYRQSCNFAAESQRLGFRIGLSDRRNSHPGTRPQQLQRHSE